MHRQATIAAAKDAAREAGADPPLVDNTDDDPDSELAYMMQDEMIL